MDHMEIVHLSLLLESADVLGAKVTEALEVLAQHAVVEASFMNTKCCTGCYS